jgi:hypothetical protein
MATSSGSAKPYKKANFIYYPEGQSDSYGNTGRVWWYGTEEQREAVGFTQRSSAQKPNWVDGTSTPGQSTINRRAPITPLPGAILVNEDQASADTKAPLGASSGSARPVVDRTTGALRTEEEEEQRLKGAVLLR